MGARAGLARQIEDDLRLSWKRSQLSGVDPAALPVPYELDLVEPDSRLWHAARPVLERFASLLEGTPTCLAFADAAARGINTWVGDSSLDPTLDALGARPGFRFAEAIAGTNGVGTPLETGRPIYIPPGQHYVEPLKPLTCAGAPVRHPLTNRLEAVINLTSVAEDKGNLLLPWVVEMVRQVEEQLYAQSSGRERLLLQHFLTTSRGSVRPVVVISPEMMLANAAATRLLENVPQALLWEFAAKAVTDSMAMVDELPGAEGSVRAIRCFPINEGGRIIGATLEFDRVRPAPPRRPATPPARNLPGLVGRSASWRRVCRQVLAVGDLARAPGVVIAGEPGVGKKSVALALLEGLGLRSEPVLFDAALEASRRPAWLDGLRSRVSAGNEVPVVVTHLDCLTDSAVRAVGAVFDETGGSGPPVVATLTVGERPVAHCAPLLDRIGQIRIDIPPLRQRPEDILDLVPALLKRLTPGTAERRAGSEVVQALTRFAWPGNVRQLEAVLRAALAGSAHPDIRLDDLPAEVRRRVAGRRLTPMEQAELDAILAALDETSGNKVTTAARLGISRSTLYRKMRSFGLELDSTVF